MDKTFWAAPTQLPAPRSLYRHDFCADNPPPPAMNTELHRPRLDPVAMARLSELDPDGRHGVVRRVLEAFESSLTRMLEQLRAQLRQGDTRAVMSVAHTLKSSAASVGALALSQACAESERRLRDGEGGDLVAVIESLIQEAESALVAVKAMLQGS